MLGELIIIMIVLLLVGLDSLQLTIRIAQADAGGVYFALVGADEAEEFVCELPITLR